MWVGSVFVSEYVTLSSMLVSILSTSYDVPGILPRYCYYPFSVVILLFCSQESHIPEDALLGENLERSLKFGFERFWRDFNFFFVAKDFVRPWAVKEN